MITSAFCNNYRCFNEDVELSFVALEDNALPHTTLNPIRKVTKGEGVNILRFITLDGQNGTGKTTLATLPEYIAKLAVYGQMERYEWCRYGSENVRCPAEFEMHFTVGEWYFKYSVDVFPESGNLIKERLISGKLEEAKFDEKEQNLYYYDATKNELSVKFLNKDSAEFKRILKMKEDCPHQSILSKFISSRETLDELMGEDVDYSNLKSVYYEMKKLLESSESSILVDLETYESHKPNDFLGESGLSSNYVAKLIEIKGGYENVYYNTEFKRFQPFDNILVLDDLRKKLYRVILVDKFLEDAKIEDIKDIYMTHKSQQCVNVYRLLNVYYRIMVGKQPLIVVDDFNTFGSESLLQNFWVWMTSVEDINPETQVILTGSLESIYRDSFGYYDCIYFMEHSPIFVKEKRTMKKVALTEYNIRWPSEWIHYWNERRMGGITYQKGVFRKVILE